MAVRTVKELTVYTKAYSLARRVFAVSKRFPSEERYALTCQIRRSSRSVCMNLPEAWAKRMYPSHFVNKLTDCDGEINETDTSIDFARDCEYITPDEYRDFTALCAEVGRMLGAMIQNPGPFLLPPPGCDRDDRPARVPDVLPVSCPLSPTPRPAPPPIRPR
jgi:four helix bundle protein